MRIFTLLGLSILLSQSLSALEAGTYIVSFIEVGKDVRPGLLITISPGPEGMKAQVIQDGYDCDAKLEITRKEVADLVSEDVEISITMKPVTKGQPAKRIMISGSTSQIKNDGTGLVDASSGAMMSEDGDWVHLRYKMIRASSKVLVK